MRLTHPPTCTLPGRWRPAWAALCLLAGAVLSWAHGDLHERIEAVSVELAQHPARAGLWLERADLHRQHGEFTEALADADQAARLKPDWPPALLQRARVLLDQQKYRLAKAAADICLEHDSHNPDALVIRARCHEHLGDTNAAISDLSVVLSGKRRPLPDLYLERARLQAGLGEPRNAVRGLDEGMARLGQIPSLALPAFEYERQSGDFQAALDRLETLRRFMPDESLMALKGEVLVQAGRGSDAAAVFVEALRELTNSAPGTIRLSRTQREQMKARLLAGLEQTTRPTTTGEREASSTP